MKFNIRIDTDYGIAWLHTSLGYVSATAFIGDQYLDEAKWKEILSSLRTPEDAVNLARQLNGSFAMALTFENSLFLCVDRQRTIPLFYEFTEDTVSVYNHISLDKIKQNGANVAAVEYLENCLFIPGEITAANGVSQVMAGQYLLVGRLGSVLQKEYISPIPVKEYSDNNELMTLIDEKFTETIKRLITVLDGRRAVIPLSGGHDSRLIVYYLKHLGYDNILTYTYGPKGNVESKTSRKVAEYLELDWYFVEYKPRKLRKLFRQEFRKLADYYSNGVSSVCVQDWYAVQELKKQGILRPSDVFVPGHSFDCISGSFILPRYVENTDINITSVYEDILWKHFQEGKRELSAVFRSNVRQLVDVAVFLNEPETVDAHTAFALYQRYNIAERQAKYICNQVRLYEYYGFSWYLPLWDTELVDFWESISLKLKYNRQVFRDFAEHKYGSLMAVAPIQNQKFKGQKIACMNPVWRVIRKLWQLWDYVGYHYCLAYFDRWTIYKVFLSTKILNIGYMVNQEMKKLFLEE